MTAPNVRIPVTPELLARFRAYHARHGAWGMFHTCLDDGNYSTFTNDGVSTWPVEGTEEERELASILEQLTPTQRAKIARLA